MLERKLRYYFGQFPSAWLLAGVVSLLMFALTLWVAPDGSLPDGPRTKLHRIFADLLGMDKIRLEGWLDFSLIFFGWLLPLILLALSGFELWRYWQDHPASDAEADVLIGLALQSLPPLAAARLGLPTDLPGYQKLILWGPRPEDFSASQELVPPHDPLHSAQGRFRVGADGLGRYARYDVLVLLRDETHLYLLDGFYDVTTGVISGERTGDYRLSDVTRLMPETQPRPLGARLALRFMDGWQYEVNLLGEREARRVFSPPEAPAIPFLQAVEQLKVFCPPPPDGAGPAQLPAPAAMPRLPAGAARGALPGRAPAPILAALLRVLRAAPIFRRSEESRQTAELERELRARTGGDREEVERRVESERKLRPGYTRRHYLQAARQRWDDEHPA